MPRSGARPRLTCVWLHGMGVDNSDFAPFADEIEHVGGPACRFVLPNAPMRTLSRSPDYPPLRAWYDIPGRNIDDAEDEFGIRASSARVAQLIDELEAEGVSRQHDSAGKLPPRRSDLTLYGTAAGQTHRRHLCALGLPAACRPVSSPKLPRQLAARRSSLRTATSTCGAGCHG